MHMFSLAFHHQRNWAAYQYQRNCALPPECVCVIIAPLMKKYGFLKNITFLCVIAIFMRVRRSNGGQQIALTRGQKYVHILINFNNKNETLYSMFGDMLDIFAQFLIDN